MDLDQKKALIELNNRFYQTVASSFSATRQHSWAGWEKLILPATSCSKLDVLDVACGNLRFKKFLAAKNLNFTYLGLDSCRELLSLSQQDQSCFLSVDLLHALIEDRSWTDLLTQDFQLVVCSAFLHHVPDFAWRQQFLTQLWSVVRPSGTLVISFWQFLKDSNLAKRIVTDLSDHDYLLDWKKGQVAQRYCHHFTDDEVDAHLTYLQDLGAILLQDFNADGATHQMNRYLVLTKPLT